MMQKAQPIRSQLLTVIMASVAAVGFATTASAAGVGAGVSAEVAAPANAQSGGNADAHMSPSGSANSNAQWQSGAAQGADRATERMSTKGAEKKPAAGTEPEATGTAAVKGKR